MPINILVVDDHDVVRNGIIKLLSDVDGIQVVGEAESGEIAVKLSKQLSKDNMQHIILMDIRMPGIGGLEAIRKILCHDPKVKIIALTACVIDPYPEKVLHAGVVGFLTKNAGLKEMVLAIQTVYAGKQYISNEVAQSLALKSIKGSKSELRRLSNRELEIMRMVVDGEKTDIIADLLCISPKTVNSYRYRIFKKLGVANNVELTHYAVNHGLCLSEV